MYEDKFLEKLINSIEPLQNGEVGIGDDSAFIFIPEGSLLITQDSFSENKHFLSSSKLNKVIKRALRASISDINAMGGRGKYLICTLGIKKENSKELNGILNLLLEECNKFNLKIIGGDTVSSDKNFITMTILGFLTQGKKPLLRSNAMPNDFIYLSGPIGKMGLSIKAIKGEKLPFSEKTLKKLKEYYYEPEIPYPLGEELLLKYKVKCCIDISDGLSIDLHRLCRRSKCGAIIEEDLIPFNEEVAKVFKNKDKRTEFLLSSGEEFQLLFTSPFELSFPKIGKIVEERKVYIKKDKKLEKLKIIGFDHFVKNDL